MPRATPPQPTSAEREAARRQNEALKKVKVTPKEGKVIQSANRSEGSGMKKGGMAKKFAKGGVTKEMPTANQMGDLNMAKGGKVKPKMADKGKPFAATKFGAALMKKSADTKGRAMVKMAKGGSVSARADGCATKGKTKTTMVKMARGGMMARGGKTC